jgi:hypothetical protein
VSPGAALVREWALHLFQMTIQGTLAAGILLAAASAARHSSPGFRSALLSVALAKFVLPPMLPFPTGVFSRFEAAPRAFFSRMGVGACAAIAVLHVAGGAVAFARFAAARRRARGWVLRSRPFAAGTSWPAGTDVRISAEVPVPCAVGGRRPAILLPEALVATLGDEAIRSIVLHEAAHLARRDPATNAFESIVSAFWWFHPLVRTVVARRRETREERCDDAVVRVLPAGVYARALVAAAALAGGSRPAGTAAATGPARDLERRLRRLSRTGRRRRPVLAVLALAAATAALLPGVNPPAGPAFHVGKSSR